MYLARRSKRLGLMERGGDDMTTTREMRGGSGIKVTGGDVAEVKTEAEVGVRKESLESAAMWRVFSAYEEQMAPRSLKMVLKSRTAASLLHRPAVLRSGNVTRASVAEGRED
jgi:hypothetical protein